MCEEQSQGMWHRWSLKHQQHEKDRAGEVRGKERQGQKSVESTTEYHCSKGGRIRSECMPRQTDGTRDEYLRAQEELNHQILKKGKQCRKRKHRRIEKVRTRNPKGFWVCSV